MPQRLRVAAAFLALSLGAAGCATHELAGFDRVGPGYSTWGGSWSTGGGISAVVRVFARDGATVVCGAWATDQQSVLSVNLNEDVMQAASAFIGRTRLVQGLGFMQRVPFAADISGAQATCVRSRVPWQPDLADQIPVLRFPRYAVPEDVGDFGFASFVVFRQTPRAPIVPVR